MEPGAKWIIIENKMISSEGVLLHTAATSRSGDCESGNGNMALREGFVESSRATEKRASSICMETIALHPRDPSPDSRAARRRPIPRTALKAIKPLGEGGGEDRDRSVEGSIA